MRVPTDFVHNRWIVAMGVAILLVTAVLAGAVDQYLDGIRADFRISLPEHINLWLLLALMIVGMLVGATALLNPVSTARGKWILAAFFVTVAVMIGFGALNGSAFIRIHSHTTVVGGD